MAETGWFEGLAEALKHRMETHGVGQAISGLKLADIPERTTKPYGMITPVAVRNQKFTNMSKYAELEFTVDVAAQTFLTLDGQVCPAITKALQNPASFTYGAVTVTALRPGDIEYEKSEQIWVAHMTFMARASQPASQNVT